MAIVNYPTYPQIKVEESAAGGFSALVFAALDTIRGQPLGLQMLNDIVANAPDGMAAWNHAKVLILLPTKKVATVSVLKPWKKVEKVKPMKAVDGGSAAYALRADLAQSGAGSASKVYWNPLVLAIPGQGPRPPFIGLAHELVHAWHNALGTKKMNYEEEERFTVGIGAYVGGATAISENRLRLEHDVPIRHAY